MLVTRQFSTGQLIFEIIKPFIEDANTGNLVESDKWIVLIHRGTVTWIGGGPLLDQATQQTALFDSPKEALKAAVDFAHSCGLQSVPKAVP